MFLFLGSVPLVPSHLCLPPFSCSTSFFLSFPIFPCPLVFCDHSNRKAAPRWKKRTPRGHPLSSCSEGRMMMRRKELREYVWIKPPPRRTLTPCSFTLPPSGWSCGAAWDCCAVVCLLIPHNAWPLRGGTRWPLTQVSCFPVTAEQKNTVKLLLADALSTYTDRYTSRCSLTLNCPTLIDRACCISLTSLAVWFIHPMLMPGDGRIYASVLRHTITVGLTLTDKDSWQSQLDPWASKVRQYRRETFPVGSISRLQGALICI